jgi:hypothetical protein
MTEFVFDEEDAHNFYAAITSVRELHSRYDAGCSCCDSVQYECSHCLTDYPCSTIKALEERVNYVS